MINKTKNIVLVGPMGAGKSTIGLILARALRREFYDTDQEVQRRTGVDLSWIFDVEGEKGFRDREAEVVLQLAQLSNVIISTGGGTVLREENRAALKESGHVILLTTDLDQQVQRTARNKYKRPSLRVSNIDEKIKTLNAEREPLYKAMADTVFVSNHRRVKLVAKEVLKFIKQEGW